MLLKNIYYLNSMWDHNRKAKTKPYWLTQICMLYPFHTLTLANTNITIFFSFKKIKVSLFETEKELKLIKNSRKFILKKKVVRYKKSDINFLFPQNPNFSSLTLFRFWVDSRYPSCAFLHPPLMPSWKTPKTYLSFSFLLNIISIHSHSNTHIYTHTTYSYR